jgi:hypothetical protein
MNTPKFTHKGWFMWCPIKIAEPDSHAPTVAARWLILEPWFTVNEAWQALMIFVLSSLNPDYEPMFMLKITGEIDNG